MKPSYSYLFHIAALGLALPVLGTCAAVQINGVCVNGNCITPNTVTYGNSESGSSSNSVTLGADPYSVSSTFGASYDSSGTHVTFNPFVKYIGGAGSTSTDTVTIDLLASFFDSSPGTWNGNYTESIPLNIASHSTGYGQVFIDGQSVGLAGPYGPGSWSYQTTKNLVGLTGDTLNYDYQFVFTFLPGTTPGSTDSSTPEPAQTIPAALTLAGFALVAIRRRRKL